MGEEHIIKTPLDVLLSTIRGSPEPLSTGRLAKICGMTEREVSKWAHVLEKSGRVKIENRFNSVLVSWAGPVEKEAPSLSPTAVYARDSALTSDIGIARRHEHDPGRDAEGQRGNGAPYAAAREKKSTVPISPSSSVDVGGGKPGPEPPPARGNSEETLIGKIGREARESEETVATEIYPKLVFGREPPWGKEAAAAKEEKADAGERKMPLENEAAEKEEEAGMAWRESRGANAAKYARAGGVPELEEEARKLLPDAEVRENWKAEHALHDDAAARESGRGEGTAARGRNGLLPKGAIRQKFRYEGAKPVKIGKMKRPAPLEITGVTLQFSERIERQMKKIERQAREIDSLRQEKEKLLSEHYLPLQNRLESELETISDRVLHIQSKVAALQKNAADLPSKISSVEKVQASSVQAHGEMRLAYDEACALLEESGRQLAEEREKMEIILEQSREELSRHSAMSGELHSTMERIGEMEGEAASHVATARAALSEQAERLASAERHSGELRALRGEIGEGIIEMKREVASAKRVLSDLERQMGQMRQIEDYTNSIRKDYDAKMLEIDDYIRNGNTEFETLRESVEANFVRRYLRELRSLTESYSFEFGQAKRMEGDIDARIAEERRKLESLFEEGKKISYLFEAQSRAPENSEKFEKRAETFTALSDISSNRSQVASMIAQVIGGRTEKFPQGAYISTASKKPEEPAPIGITRIISRAKARRKAAKKPAAFKSPRARSPARATKAPNAAKLKKANAAAPLRKAASRTMGQKTKGKRKR